MSGRVEGAEVRHDVARVRRLVAKAAGRVDRAEHAHQHGERAHRLEAVRVRRQAAHRVERDRPRLRRRVLLAPGVGPGDRQLEGLLAARSRRARARACAMRAAGMPVIAAAHSGVHGATRSRSSWNDGATRVPSASV